VIERTGESMRKYSNCLKESRFFLDLGLVILYIFSAYIPSVTIVLLSSSELFNWSPEEARAFKMMVADRIYK
jgi:hypothetical protein